MQYENSVYNFFFFFVKDELYVFEIEFLIFRRLGFFIK